MGFTSEKEFSSLLAIRNWNIKQYTNEYLPYCMSMKSCPFLPYKNGKDFLDTHNSNFKKENVFKTYFVQG